MESLIWRKEYLWRNIMFKRKFTFSFCYSTWKEEHWNQNVCYSKTWWYQLCPSLLAKEIYRCVTKHDAWSLNMTLGFKLNSIYIYYMLKNYWKLLADLQELLPFVLYTNKERETEELKRNEIVINYIPQQ